MLCCNRIRLILGCRVNSTLFSLRSDKFIVQIKRLLGYVDHSDLTKLNNDIIDIHVHRYLLSRERCLDSKSSYCRLFCEAFVILWTKYMC